MAFSYEEKVIIKYFRIKYKRGATRTVMDHLEYEWKINGVNKLLKKIDELVTLFQKKSFDNLSLYATKRTLNKQKK